MKLYKHIVCAFDNSEFARKALDYAVKLTMNAVEKMTILYVMVNPFIFEGGHPILRNNILALDLFGSFYIKVKRTQTNRVANTAVNLVSNANLIIKKE